MSETEDGSRAALRTGFAAHSRDKTSGNSAAHSSMHSGTHSGGKSNAHKALVAFHRTELDVILRVYGRRVAEGEWRDYAIDHMTDRAIFSIFRRASEMPLYKVEKVPALARKQGAYRVVATGGTILKRGHDLAQVLKILDRPKLKLVSG
ncbi:hypothetical protein J2R99_001503 [Rhodopseudomonas julia]|uniref:DUF2794 domain-containing protein n=2 Tax=Rhodopseudomonas julia TaxID=200617 RepID=A0ABU0C570_9BRAD|nr:hypothetical protein [Rhodopseudomonas julia]